MKQQSSKQEVIDFFAALFYGEHHIPGEITECGYGWKLVMTYGSLATFDYNGLTRLVLLAHDRCMRAEIEAKGMSRLIIKVHKRTRTGSFSECHPTIEDNIRDIRESKYYNEGLENTNPLNK